MEILMDVINRCRSWFGKKQRCRMTFLIYLLLKKSSELDHHCSTWGASIAEFILHHLFMSVPLDHRRRTSRRPMLSGHRFYYAVANLISAAEPTEVDIQRTLVLEKVCAIEFWFGNIDYFSFLNVRVVIFFVFGCLKFLVFKLICKFRVSTRTQ